MYSEFFGQCTLKILTNAFRNFRIHENTRPTCTEELSTEQDGRADATCEVNPQVGLQTSKSARSQPEVGRPRVNHAQSRQTIPRQCKVHRSKVTLQVGLQTPRSTRSQPEVVRPRVTVKNATSSRKTTDAHTSRCILSICCDFLNRCFRCRRQYIIRPSCSSQGRPTSCRRFTCRSGTFSEPARTALLF